MADELKINANISFSKDRKKYSKSYGGIEVDVTGTDYVVGTQSIATSATAINVGEIGNEGYIYAKNLDTTNYVELHNGSSGTHMVKLLPGDVCLFKLFKLVDGTPDLHATANEAAVEIEYAIIED